MRKSKRISERKGMATTGILVPKSHLSRQAGDPNKCDLFESNLLWSATIKHS